MKKIILAAVVAAFLAGCASTPTEAPVEDKSSSTDAAATASTGASTAGTTTAGIGGTATGANPLKDPNNILSKRSIFYDYDKYDVKDEYKPLLQAHAKYLAQNQNAKMLIQGNADERGSREYNIALGQKRADGVKKMLQLMGVRETQMESVSLGEEKPRCTEATEDCYAQNRRSDMLYGGEY